MPLKIKQNLDGEAPVINKWADGVEQRLDDLETSKRKADRSISSISTTVSTVVDTAAPTTADNPTGVSASENGYIIDGVLYSEVTCSYTAPATLANFAGVFLVIKNYRGSAELFKVAEHQFTGAAAGSASFKVTLQRTGETVTLYFVPKNSKEASLDDWTTAPSTTAVLDGNASAPNAPSGVSASAQQLGVSLSWSENIENNMKSYNVYRNTSNSFAGATNLATVASSGTGSASYFDKAVTTGNTYFYWITAVNTAKQESTASTGVSATAGTANLDTDVGDGTTWIRMSSRQSDLVIDNGDFELALVGGVPPGWKNGGTINAGGTLSYVTGGSQYSGTNSLQVVSAAQFEGVQFARILSVKPGEVYQISAALKAVSGTAAAQLWFGDQSLTFKGSVTATSSSAAWTVVSATGVVPAGATQGFLLLENSNAGAATVQFDQVKISRLLPASQVQPMNTSGTFSTANPLSNDGISTTITVASSTMQFGDFTVTYNAGSVNPGAFNSVVQKDWFVYVDDPGYQGGAVTYQAVEDFTGTGVLHPFLYAASGRISFGHIHTSSGSGGSSGGGGGTGGGRGTF